MHYTGKLIGYTREVVDTPDGKINSWVYCSKSDPKANAETFAIVRDNIL